MPVAAAALPRREVISPVIDKPQVPADRPKRLNIALCGAAFSDLEKLSKTGHRSMTETIKLALSILVVAASEVSRGHRLAIIADGDKVVKELVIPR